MVLRLKTRESRSSPGLLRTETSGWLDHFIEIIPLFRDRWIKTAVGLWPAAVFYCAGILRGVEGLAPNRYLLVMPKKSAGLLLYRKRDDRLEVLLVHPGGPFWAKKDDGAWSIPKGEYEEGEDPLAVARREFAEELGTLAIADEFADLGEIIQAGGKRVRAFAAEGDFDVGTLRSNTFEMEWPPRSGRKQSFPEVDRAEWFGIDEARSKILAGQRPFLDRLLKTV